LRRFSAHPCTAARKTISDPYLLKITEIFRIKQQKSSLKELLAHENSIFRRMAQLQAESADWCI
jgi:hypothetical protein